VISDHIIYDSVGEITFTELVTPALEASYVRNDFLAYYTLHSTQFILPTIKINSMVNIVQYANSGELYC